MAEVILKEFVEPGHKALIYCGMHHAFTRYRQPIISGPERRVTGRMNDRTGNLVRERIGDRTFTVALHQPWDCGKRPGHMYPASGAIDVVMRKRNCEPVGFDVVETPFSEIEDSETYYALGYKKFMLGDFCDGYIFLQPFSGARSCRVDREFVTWSNVAEASNHSPNPKFRESWLHRFPFAWDILMRSNGDMEKRMADLH